MWSREFRQSFDHLIGFMGTGPRLATASQKDWPRFDTDRNDRTAFKCRSAKFSPAWGRAIPREEKTLLKLEIAAVDRRDRRRGPDAAGAVRLRELEVLLPDGRPANSAGAAGPAVERALFSDRNPAETMQALLRERAVHQEAAEDGRHSYAQPRTSRQSIRDVLLLRLK